MTTMMDRSSFVYLLFFSQIFSLLDSISANSDGCPDSYFLGCVTKLRLQRVPFDQNMLNVVFNVTSEAKLRQTCIAYSDVLPCFRDRILQCGNEKQKQLLDEVAKMIMFFCSPFSAKRQESFLKYGVCIGKVLQMPATTDCYTEAHPEFAKIEQCRKICYDKREFLCMMKIWVSEQNFCTLLDVEKNCNKEAGEFYQQLQVNVFSESFPIICDFVHKNDTTPFISSDISPMDPVEFFENAKALSMNRSTSSVIPPSLPPTIPVIYSQKTRPTEPPPIILPTYLPVNPGPWQSEFFTTRSPTNSTNKTAPVVEVTVTVTHPSTPIEGGSLWGKSKETDGNKYPFNQPLPDSTEVRVTTPAQWKPWYLGGSTTDAEDGVTTEATTWTRMFLSDDKDPLWNTFKKSSLVEFGRQIFQNSNSTIIRKDIDNSYRSLGWPFVSNCKKAEFSVQMLFVTALVVLLLE